MGRTLLVMWRKPFSHTARTRTPRAGSGSNSAFCTSALSDAFFMCARLTIR
jgi:hypothetical protein